jgi:hypothetical protein
MKQSEDTRAGDLLDAAPPRRGRLFTGKALSGADRQRQYRERLREKGRETLTVDVPQEVAEALRRYVEFKDMTQGEAVERILRDRLLRKRCGWVFI